MNPDETKKKYGRNFEIQLYIGFLLVLVSSIANILLLFLSLFILLIIITLRFRNKNYKSELYYVFQVTIIILQGIVLFVSYLYRSIYLNSLSLMLLFCGFVAFYVFLITLSIYFNRKGIPLYH